MARKRTIKNYGSSGWKINLFQQDISDLKIVDGALIDIEDCVIENPQEAEENLKDCIARQNNSKREEEIKKRLEQ
jgi:hypothetical protein